MTAQEHISKVARMLANQQADACGVDREDNWRLYGEEFIAATAEAMSSVLAHIDQQQAEIERLRSESEERLQNCAALVAENEQLRKDAEQMREALMFYAEGDHFTFDRDAWDTVSDEPQNYWCDEAGTATVEDGTIAKLALDAAMKGTL